MAKIIYNKIIPFKGYTAMALLPFIFSRVKELKDYVVNHESIHLRQQLEMLIVGAAIAIVMFVLGCGWWSLMPLPLFLWWYGIEYLIRLWIYNNYNQAYRNVAMEQEAYIHQNDMEYLANRKVFAWVRFLGKTTFR